MSATPTHFVVIGRPFRNAWLDSVAEAGLCRLAASHPGMVHSANEGIWWIGERIGECRGDGSGEPIRFHGPDLEPDAGRVERIRAFCEAMPEALARHPDLLPFGRWVVQAS